MKKVLTVIIVCCLLLSTYAVCSAGWTKDGLNIRNGTLPHKDNDRGRKQFLYFGTVYDCDVYFTIINMSDKPMEFKILNCPYTDKRNPDSETGGRIRTYTGAENKLDISVQPGQMWSSRTDPKWGALPVGNLRGYTNYCKQFGNFSVGGAGNNCGLEIVGTNTGAKDAWLGCVPYGMKWEIGEKWRFTTDGIAIQFYQVFLHTNRNGQFETEFNIIATKDTKHWAWAKTLVEDDDMPSPQGNANDEGFTVSKSQ